MRVTLHDVDAKNAELVRKNTALTLGLRVEDVVVSTASGGGMQAYLYVCYRHETQGVLQGLMSTAEKHCFATLALTDPKKHLAACQIRGCQDLRDRIILTTLAPPAKH